MKPHVWFIRALSRLVPRRWRTEWQREWNAELHYRECAGRTDVMRHSLGAFWDALAMQPRRLEEEMFQDLRYGVRMLVKNKGITAIAVLSLALGIGVNSALFSLVDTLFIRTLPVRNPADLVELTWTSGPNKAYIGYDGHQNGGSYHGSGLPNETIGSSFSYPIFQALRSRNQTLSDIFAFAGIIPFNVIADGRAAIANGQLVSGNYFRGLGLEAFRGRLISDSDDAQGAEAVAVISHRYWERRFDSDPAAVGKQITINKVPFTIIGIAPAGFFGTLQVNEAVDVSIPMATEPSLPPFWARRSVPLLQQSAEWWLQIMGRLRPEVTFEQVRANLEQTFQESALENWRIAVRMLPPDRVQRSQTPPDMQKLNIIPSSRGLEDARNGYWKPTLILLAIVAAVLLIACINIANLMLARSETRQREIGIRLAIGAGRFRLIRQLLTESVLLALCGGAAGTFFAYGGQRLLVSWGPWTTPTEAIDLKLDFRVFAFTAVLSLFSGLLFGILPAVRTTQTGLHAAIKQRARAITGRRSYLTTTLLATQVAASLLMLIAAGLFIRTIQNLYHIDPGFDSGNVLLFDLDPSINNYDAAQMSERFGRAVELIQAIPGIRDASLSQRPLLSGGSTTTTVTTPDGISFDASILYVHHNFFRTMGIPFSAGRPLTAADRKDSQPVAVINEALARKYFAKGNAIGSQLDGKQIIGIVRDVRYRQLRQEPPPTMYVPYTQGPVRQMTFEVRSAVNISSLLPLIREQIHQVDANLPISNVRTQVDQINRTMVSERLFAMMSGLFGFLALLLACVGLYGVMSYSVARRTSEIGVRMALGAERRHVLRSVVAESLRPVAAGVVLGLAGALALTQTIESMLFGLTRNDPATIAAAILIMVTVAVFAGYWPARRASKVDPITALRHE